MDPSQVIVIVPMKPLAVAKSRLGGSLEPHQRRALAGNLLQQVLKAGQESDFFQTWVVGGDPEVHELARSAGAIWMPDAGTGLNETVEWAFRKALETGKAALYIPADLPFVRPADLSQLAQSAGNLAQVALAPDRRGTGTNAILLAGPAPFRPALGAGSFQRHLAQVASLGVRPVIYYSRSLAWDLDTPEDLDFYEAISPGLAAKLVMEPPGETISRSARRRYE